MKDAIEKLQQTEKARVAATREFVDAMSQLPLMLWHLDRFRTLVQLLANAAEKPTFDRACMEAVGWPAMHVARALSVTGAHARMCLEQLEAGSNLNQPGEKFLSPVQSIGHIAARMATEMSKDRQDPLSYAFREAVDLMRLSGLAVAVFTEEEVGNKDPRELEAAMCKAACNFLEGTQ